jgi:hypothetical protein
VVVEMKMLTSWRTSLSGVLPGVIILLTQFSHLLDADPKTVCDTQQLLAALSLISIGLTARDNAVTSKQAGAK